MQLPASGLPLEKELAAIAQQSVSEPAAVGRGFSMKLRRGNIQNLEY
jgi:hypothetical protein